MEVDQEKPKFKSISRNKAARIRIKTESDSDDEEETSLQREKIEEMKMMRKLRHRPSGISISTLLPDENGSADELVRDRLKVISGGLVDAKSLKDNMSKVDDAYDTGIGTQFSAETNKRDEDDEMMKYIDEEVKRRKQKFAENNESATENSNKSVDYFSPEDAALQALPEHLKISTAHHSEEMLSNQMLSGIPEVDLGIEAKIKNIEATEEAKLKLLWARQNKTAGPSAFVPSNMAVNFVQHNRFSVEDTAAIKREKSELLQKKTDKRPLDKEQKATDDYHYERFKKQFRRY